MKSALLLNDCPADGGREVAFCGRSNAGKSSAINTLTESARLARTSKTPGRTQLLNLFELPDGTTLLGGAIIVASGIYLVRSERRRSAAAQ